MAELPSHKELEFSKELQRHETPINGLYVYDLTVHGDERGWFKENWQREKMTAEAIGLPDFGPVQNNISFNAKKGVTRGLHAEPWDKYISTGSGRVFGAWVDLRQGSQTYGRSFSIEINPGVAVYVPRGVANGFQALEDNTVYTYLVNDHWSPDAQYANVSIFDESLQIHWPIPLQEATVSEKDHTHPLLKDATPILPKKTLITGANGQIGRALQAVYPNAEFVTHKEFDITDPSLATARRWRDYETIINAAAYTAVDLAETEDGRREAWRINAEAVANLARIARDNNITLVHISSDYVFDGTKSAYTEEDPFSPLGVYGQTKAAGDIAAATAPKHYIVRSSWVVGDGKNFVRTMASLAEKGLKPKVVTDQVGRITFADDVARGIDHLIKTAAPYGTYNLSSDGETASWYDIAQAVYTKKGQDPAMVTPTSTVGYFSDAIIRAKQQAEQDGTPYTAPIIAPRPLQSTLNIDKIQKTGFSPRRWRDALAEYLSQ